MARELMSESMMNEIHDRESINIISVANGRSWLYDKLIKSKERKERDDS